ncbi:E3 ubiquitin-protein ligase [Nymphaea thermarum]|nr:E3 ubiquitin-protein ligase [Nymphaea thermarum]
MASVVVEDKEARCAVCLEGFGANREARGTPCKHKFHNGCITKWLEEYRTCTTYPCPLCRFQMPVKENKPVAGSGVEGEDEGLRMPVEENMFVAAGGNGGRISRPHRSSGQKNSGFPASKKEKEEARPSRLLPFFSFLRFPHSAITTPALRSIWLLKSGFRACSEAAASGPSLKAAPEITSMPSQFPIPVEENNPVAGGGVQGEDEGLRMPVEENTLVALLVVGFRERTKG